MFSTFTLGHTHIPLVVFESVLSVVGGSHWPGADLDVILTPRSGHSDDTSLLPTLCCWDEGAPVVAGERGWTLIDEDGNPG